MTGRSGGRRTPDHPRSRGVYWRPRRSTGRWTGSSPLARGLRPRAPCPRGPPGIIPARAGFTAGSYPASFSVKDHPRSRGVYESVTDAVTRAVGSSPLARGLLGGGAARTLLSGIIPARAGFTQRPHGPGGLLPDHPRSRGVYRRLDRHHARRVGSSPLARGLHAGHGRLRPGGGIIPARAGFTRPQRHRHPHPRDHPRSRGVYDSTVNSPPAHSGSSPLARGLLLGAGDDRESPGIIPARAGFTRLRGARGPRGRGSSPLARGLRSQRVVPVRDVGIIPARAGFTPPRSSQRPSQGDHPRSRGVYSQPDRLNVYRDGSSPLARGLPGGAGGCTWAERIIPARAGFTGLRGGHRLGDEDHPRSRGVYSPASSREPPRPGSSPLARGLREAIAAALDRARIIPARAGFTWDRNTPATGTPDHPRSRGVYACGSLVSQRTRSLPDPRRLHCRPRARSAGSP